MNLECLYDKIKDLWEANKIYNDNINGMTKTVNGKTVYKVQFVNSRRFFKLKDKYIFLTNVKEGDKLHVYLIRREMIVSDMFEIDNIILEIND